MDPIHEGGARTDGGRELLAEPLEKIAEVLSANPDAGRIELELTWPEGHTLDFAETCRRAAGAIREMS